MNEQQLSVIHDDPGIEPIVHCYSALHDWLDNTPIGQRGGRTSQRIDNVIENGIYPLTERYVEFVLSKEDVDTEFDETPEELLNKLQIEHYPDYVDTADEHDFEDYGRSLTRAQLDAEVRLGRFAVKAGQAVNRQTDHYKRDCISEEFADEIDEIWIEWWYELDDLFWERRYKLSHDTLQDIENEPDDENDGTLNRRWEKNKNRYPEFPIGTVINGEKIWQ